jgi:hypothetical protein
VIKLSRNQLTGRIPEDWSALKKVETLELAHNNIGGENTSQLWPLWDMGALVCIKKQLLCLIVFLSLFDSVKSMWPTTTSISINLP